MTEWIWPKNLKMTKKFKPTNLKVGTWPKMYYIDKHKRVNMTEKKIIFQSNSPIHVCRLNVFLLIHFWSYLSIFWSCSTVKVRRCNLLVKFQHSHSSMWIFFGHILTHFWHIDLVKITSLKIWSNLERNFLGRLNRAHFSQLM